MKVEIVATPPSGTRGERFTYETDRGRIVVAATREGAHPSERQAAAEALEACRQPDDITLVVPHGYDVKVFEIASDVG